MKTELLEMLMMNEMEKSAASILKGGCGVERSTSATPIQVNVLAIRVCTRRP